MPRFYRIWLQRARLPIPTTSAMVSIMWICPYFPCWGRRIFLAIESHPLDNTTPPGNVCTKTKYKSFALTEIQAQDSWTTEVIGGDHVLGITLVKWLIAALINFELLEKRAREINIVTSMPFFWMDVFFPYSFRHYAAHF